MTDQVVGSGIGLVIIVGFIVAGLVVYLLPTILAVVRKKENTAAVAVLNLLLGWTFVGWVVALVWAVSTQVVDQPARVKVATTPVLCAACGKYSPPTTKFCGHCGAALA